MAEVDGAVKVGLDLTTAHRGLRFADPVTERTYLEWHSAKAIPYTRLGLVASIGGWIFAAVLANLALEGDSRLRMGTGVAFLSVCLLVTFLRPRWCLFVAAVSNSVGALIALWVTFGTYHMPESAMVMTIFTFFGFAVFRMHPGPAASTVLVYLAVHTVLLHDALAHGDVPRATMAAIFTWNAFFMGLLICVIIEHQMRKSFADEQTIEALLLNILPASIAERLKAGPGVIADRFDDVTILFADLVGFTPLAATMEPEAVVSMLNEVFTLFDRLADLHGVEKIKTIGDAYMAVGGLPEARPDHATAVADLALAMRDAIDGLAVATGLPIGFRIGVCSGPAVAGVIGLHKFAYDLWGDAVNVAARMESHGVAGTIQVAESTYWHLRDDFDLTARGSIHVKGKGVVDTWTLNRRKPVRVQAPAAVADMSPLELKR